MKIESNRCLSEKWWNESLTPGIYLNVSEWEYYESEKWRLPSYSSVKTLALGGTPAHCFAKMQGDDTESDSREFGKLVHTALLNPEKLKNTEQLPEHIRQRRGKEWESLKKEFPNTSFIPASEWKKFEKERDIAYRIRDNFLNHPVISQFFENVHHEASFVWMDAESGVKCKGRIDLLAKDFSFIADPKTTSKIIPYQTTKNAYYYGYHIQAAMYTDAIVTLQNIGLKEAGKDLIDFNDFEKMPKFEFLFVESAPPYLPSHADGHAAFDERTGEEDPYGYLKFGRESYKYALKTIADCMRNNSWPGHQYDSMSMVIPKWAGQEGVYV